MITRNIFNQETGNINYPRMNGDINLDGFKSGIYEIETLRLGTIIDRYGNNSSGRYFAPLGTSYEERALTSFMENTDYTQYKLCSQ